DGAIETDVRRIVARDHLARGVERDRGLERRQFVEALPAVVEGNPRFGLEAAGGVGLRATAAPPLAVDGDREFGKRGRTRRLGGRLYRRVLEGMRGCSAHAVNITCRKNKSRTRTQISQNNPMQSKPPAPPTMIRRAAKICRRTGCFDCDKVIT